METNPVVTALRREQASALVFYLNYKKFHWLTFGPHFRDYLIFPEYFHGDTGRGCGAARQTGWTGLIAKLLRPRRRERSCPVPTSADAAPT